MRWLRSRWLLLPCGLLLSVLLSALHAQEDPAQAVAAGPAGDWWRQAQRALAAREYHASVTAAGLQAPNRAQGFRTYFESHGIRVVERGSREPQDLLRLRLRGLGRAGVLAAVGAGTVSHRAQRVEIARPGVTEWYENRAEGLEQGFTVSARPAGMGALRLELQVSGASAVGHGAEIALRSDTGQRLRYGHLVAWDAQGQPVAAYMDSDGDTLSLIVEDAAAVYPLTIDPLLTAVGDTQLEVNQPFAKLGYSVAGAGDVNGDGYADVIVGAQGFDNGEPDEGAAFVYHGGASGVSPTAAAQLESNQVFAFLGWSVAGAGDVNGDGYADVIVGAQGFDNGEPDEGAAFVYHGGASGVIPIAAARLEVNQGSANLGISVAGAGDVNGDGYADVIVGAQGFDNGHTDEGAAFVYHGGASGVNTTAAAQLEANQGSANLGWSVAGAGDVNGDGYADVLVGAYLFDNGESDEGAAFVYHGGASGVNTTAAAQLEANQGSANLGWSVAGAGDVNGDGYADIIVGAWLFDNGESDEGAVFVYHGGVSGVSPTAAAQLEANQGGANLGWSVAGAGDVNGDGYADVIVGAYLFDNGQADEGAAFVYYGGASGVIPIAAAQLEANQVNANLGRSVAGAGDVNGDGYADVLVGAWLFDNGQTDEGTVFVYHGGASGVSTTVAAQLEANQVGASLGTSVAGAGDVNGDGYADVIVGAYGFDNGEADEGAAFVYHGGASGVSMTAATQLEANQANAYLGVGVAGAGDVNGDGYADVIVGAYGFDNGEADEGAAFVYHGGASGVSTLATAQLEANQESVFMGNSVAGAGDVNGDGYADVLVGAWLFDNGQTDEGAVFVYHGGASGVSPTAATQLEGNQEGASLGTTVAGAGDVNGDGYADVLVGAYLFDNGQVDEGAAFVYHGGVSGVSPTAAAQLEANQANAALGWSVAGVGDVNGDGYADVLVGAYLFDNGQVDEGAAFVYHGGVSGVSPTATAQLEANQANAGLGYSAAGAGDVNGDGYADVTVGAWLFDNGESDEGAAFVYHGGASGVSTTVAAQLEANQVSANQGISVAGAGDVNGDGYADVIVGAYLFDNGQIDEGAAFVYHGNRNGRPVHARQFRTDGSTPVQPWGLSYDRDAFAVAMRVTSPRGRERVKLEAQVCPAGSDFGGGCVTVVSPAWSDVTATSGGITLPVAVTGLTPGTLYHWRARSLHAPYTVTAGGTTAPTNPSHGPWRRLSAREEVGDIRAANAITLRFGSAASSVAENAGPAAVALVVTTSDLGPSSQAASVDYASADGTATVAGNDYTATSGTLSIPSNTANNAAFVLSVPIVNDGVVEPDETFSLGLSNATRSGLIAPSTHTITITTPQADLSLTKTDGVSTAVPGQAVTYTLVAANAGPDNTTGAMVVDTFPAECTTVTWTCVGTGGGTCTTSGTGNINDTVDLPDDASVTYTATCTISAAAAGTLVNTATVTALGGVGDPTPGNNSATDTDTLDPTADLALTKTDGASTAGAGQAVTYTIVATNAGPSAAPGATVTDTFPAALTCTWTCGGTGSGTCTASGTGNINDTVGLPAGSSVTYTATCTLAAAATGTLVNTASVTAPGGVTDPTPGNNSATDTDTICTYTVTPLNQVVGAGGGTQQVGVTTQAGCAWTAGSNVSWVTITGGSPGTGSGTIQYTVTANPGPNPRRGTLTIAGTTFIVSQQTPVPTPCTISVSPPGSPIAASGGTGSVTLTASTGSCGWWAQSQVPWITLTSAASGSGSGTVQFSVATNPGGPRAGRLTVNGKRVTITQN